MNDQIINKIVGGVIVVIALYACYWTIKFLWRLATGAAKKVADAAPGTLERSARFAGSASAAAEKSAANVLKAFKEGRAQK